MARIGVLQNAFHNSDILSTHAGMAYFSNTGPLGFACEQCGFYKKNKCLKFMLMTGKGGIAFPGETASCKFFENEK
jgi:hypothetical protein